MDWRLDRQQLLTVLFVVVVVVGFSALFLLATTIRSDALIVLALLWIPGFFLAAAVVGSRKRRQMTGPGRQTRADRFVWFPVGSLLAAAAVYLFATTEWIFGYLAALMALLTLVGAYARR